MLDLKGKFRYIFLLTIDSLQYNKLIDSENSVETMPTVTELFRNGIACSEAISNGQPTQMSFPSIFTSTMPLDFGGYDLGINNRNTTLTEILKRNGYNTVGFCTTNVLSKYFAYDRGFDSFYELYNLKRFWKSRHKAFYKHYISCLANGDIGRDEFVEAVGSSIKKTFSYMLWHCEQKIEEEKKKIFTHNHIVHNSNFLQLKELVIHELRSLEQNCQEYLSDYSKYQQIFHRIINQSRYGCGLVGEICAYLDEFCEKLMVKVQAKLGFSYPYILKRYDHFVTADYLEDSIIKWIGFNGRRPFFLWTHFLDIHEGSYTSSNLQLPPLFTLSPAKRCRFSKEELKKFHTKYATERAHKFVDKKIKNIINYLKKKNMLDDSLIVITSDHGMALMDKEREGHKATLFYEEYIRVPMVFYNPQIKPKHVDSLCSHLDLAPTVLDLLGLPCVDEFVGQPVYSEDIKSRKYVISENAGRGACDLKRKSINLAIRTKDFKYMCTEHKDLFNIDNKLYNIVNDQAEKINLVTDPQYRDVILDFGVIAQERYRKVREVYKNLL